jgi:hypothetical protein
VTGCATRAGIAASIGLALGLGACRIDIPATEIVVTLDTTFGVPCTIDAVHVEAVGTSDPGAVDFPITELPGTLVLFPLGDPRDVTVTVTVTAMRSGEVFATAMGQTTFEREASREMRFLLDDDCVPGPCQAVDVGRYVGLPPAAPRRGCGERGYAVKDALFAMRDACSMREAIMGTMLVNVDEKEELLPTTPAMPFPFWFYGQPVTQLWVGDNGYIGLGNARPNALQMTVGASRSLGERGFPGKGALPFWNDLRTGNAGVCYAVSGKFPDRILWITWKEACFANDMGRPCGSSFAGTLTFGVALEETTDRIYFGYRTMVATMGNAERANGRGVTIGVAEAAASGCARSLCSLEGTCQNGKPCGYTEFTTGEAVAPFPTLEFDPQ